MLANNEIACTFEDLTIIHHNKPMTHFEVHDHDVSECIIPLFGAVEFQFSSDNHRLEVKPGQMILIPQNLQHSATSKERFGERLILLLHADRIQFADVRVAPRSQLLVELCFELFESGSSDPEMRNQCKDLLCHLLSRLARDTEAFPAVDIQGLVARVKDPRLKKILSHFEQNPALPAKMSDFAAKGGLSERSMQRLFKAELNVTPLSVLTMYRIERAIQLLRSGESVTQTAYSVGYESLSQFVAQFRNLTGRIPSDFMP